MIRFRHRTNSICKKYVSMFHTRNPSYGTYRVSGNSLEVLYRLNGFLRISFAKNLVEILIVIHITFEIPSRSKNVLVLLSCLFFYYYYYFLSRVSMVTVDSENVLRSLFFDSEVLYVRHLMGAKKKTTSSCLYIQNKKSNISDNYTN